MLDAVPGYDTAPPHALFIRAVEEVGGAIIGPLLDLAPANRKLFPVRDVTATVESVPLITGSILLKKLASSPRGLVITVGSGSGAYMKTLDDARRLARSMAEVAARVGVPSVMLLSDLSCVLGTSVGNAVAVKETVDFLRRASPGREGARPRPVHRCRDGRFAGRDRPDLGRARGLAAAKLEDVSAADHSGRMVRALGGPNDFGRTGERLSSGRPICPPGRRGEHGNRRRHGRGRNRTCAGRAWRRPQTSGRKDRSFRGHH